MNVVFKIVLALLLFNTITIQAQTIIPIENYFNYNHDDNVYFKDVNGLFNKFLGTWEYSDGEHYFKITLTKKESFQYSKDIRTITQFTDYMDCYYIYKHNGVTIYDFYPVNGVLTDFSGSGIRGFNYVVDTQNNLYLDYDEPVTNSCTYRNKWGRVKVTFLGGQLQQLLWTRTDRNKSYPLSFGCADTSDFKIPAVMTLTKIN